MRLRLQKSISCAIPRWIPDLRLKLYVAFARARCGTRESTSDPKTADRAWPRHAGLQDFLDVYDD